MDRVLCNVRHAWRRSDWAEVWEQPEATGDMCLWRLAVFILISRNEVEPN